ncbi:MAG TPA: hypothetical protein VIW01_06240 [Dehalococcoidia bacterium]
MLTRVIHLPLALAAVLLLLLAFSLASERQTEAGQPLPTCGESNSGWESGDLTGWSQGTVTEIIEVVGVESVGGGEYTVGPLEGARMLRLGDAKDSSGENQPPG